ncbi:TPA: hypothetical protein I8007_001987 [Legionella pneumophila]|nr:hypothetical protein [Legionella pneumophila]
MATLAASLESKPNVSVVGFLDEGLLARSYWEQKDIIMVSVVGFLDEGLLVHYRKLPTYNPISFSGWIFR